MPSDLDPKNPADGSPARKADLRNALSVIKRELEHGGYVTVPGQSARERQVRDKLSDLFAAADFGEADTLVEVLKRRAGAKNGQFALVSGGTAINDAAGGIFVWDGSSSLPHDGGTVLQPTSVTGAGRWRRIFQETVNVRWFGAKGDDTADDTAAFQAALATGKNVFVPNGTYRVVSTLTIGANGKSQALIGENSERTLIRYVGSGVAIQAIYHRCRLETFALWGCASNYSVTHGAVGLVLGTGPLSGDKIYARGLNVRYFRKAGIVLNGLQNAAIVDTNASFNGCNWLVTNATRNISLFNCNSSDWPNSTATTAGRPSWIPQDIWDRAPNVRGFYFGMPSWIEPEVPLNTWAPGTNYVEKIPSNVFFFGSINERFDRHDAIFEVREFNGLLVMHAVELTRTAPNGSLLLLKEFENGTSNAPNALRQVALYNPQFNQSTPTSSEKFWIVTNEGSHPVRVSGYETSFSVRGPAIYLDNPTAHLLEAEPVFDGTIKGWVAQTGNDDVGWSNNRLRYTAKSTAGSARCAPHFNLRFGYKSLSGRLMKLTVVPTLIANEVNGSGDSYRLQMELPASPWVTDVLTLKPNDVNTEKTVIFPLASNMTGAIRITCANGISLVTGTAVGNGGGNNTVKLAANATGNYVGRRIRLTSGQGSGQFATITAFDPATQIATTDTVWASPGPGAGTNYVIEPVIELARVHLALVG